MTFFIFKFYHVFNYNNLIKFIIKFINGTIYLTNLMKFEI